MPDTRSCCRPFTSAAGRLSTHVCAASGPAYDGGAELGIKALLPRELRWDVLDRLFAWLFDAPYLATLWKSKSLGFWRNVTLILLVLGVAAVVLLVKQRHRISAFLRHDEHRQHDRAIFAGADALLTEMGLMDTLRTLTSLHAFTRDELRAMTRFGYYFEETGHPYLDKSIGDATERLLRSLSNLLDFTAQYFRPYGLRPEARGGSLCMLPSLNREREGSPADIEGQVRYDKHARELDELIGAVTQLYRDYRKIVKTRLTV